MGLIPLNPAEKYITSKACCFWQIRVPPGGPAWTETGMGMLEVKLPGQGVLEEGADSPLALLQGPGGHWVSLVLPSLPITAVPPSLSLPFLPGPCEALPPRHSIWRSGAADNNDDVGHLSPCILEGEASPHPRRCQTPACPGLFPCLLLSALVTGYFQPSSGPILTLQQQQDGGDGEHGHCGTVQGLWCLLATSDGTSGTEGLHPRVLIFPQGGFMWEQGSLLPQWR